MDTSSVLSNGIVGQKQGPFLIALNDISKDFESCEVYAANAGILVGGSRIPLEIFCGRNVMYPECAHTHAPWLAKILEEYYEGPLSDGCEWTVINEHKKEKSDEEETAC